MAYLDLFFSVEKHFLLSLCTALGDETHSENYLLCNLMILSMQ